MSPLATAALPKGWCEICFEKEGKKIKLHTSNDSGHCSWHKMEDIEEYERTSNKKPSKNRPVGSGFSGLVPEYDGAVPSVDAVLEAVAAEYGFDKNHLLPHSFGRGNELKKKAKSMAIFLGVYDAKLRLEAAATLFNFSQESYISDCLTRLKNRSDPTLLREKVRAIRTRYAQAPE